MLLLHPVPTERVVIEAGVFKEAHPFLPAWGHVGAVVLIQVLSEESWRGEGTERPGDSSERKPFLGTTHPSCASGLSMGPLQAGDVWDPLPSVLTHRKQNTQDYRDSIILKHSYYQHIKIFCHITMGVFKSYF